MEEQTSGRRTPRHLKSIILELHRFQPLDCLLAAAAALLATLLQKLFKWWKVLVLAIGQVYYVHLSGCWMGRRRHSVAVPFCFHSLVSEVGVPDGFRRRFESG